MIEFEFKKTLKAQHGEMNLEIAFKILPGSFLTLYGDSGAGKTSTLRMISGLMKPDSGFFSINGKVWTDTSKGIFIPPQKRSIGYMFQEYALFPNMTVRGNLEYALPSSSGSSSVDELIEIMALGELQHRMPQSLSGGQQQRVALARALVRKPEILLLDEPLSALDYSMRHKLQDHILEVHKRFKLTTILVSHELSEIIKMSDQVMLIENGKVTRKGHPMEVFTNKRISGKFQFTGEILQIQKEDVIYVVTVMAGNNIVKVVAQDAEVNNLKIGDKVLVAAKAFSPSIQKIN